MIKLITLELRMRIRSGSHQITGDPYMELYTMYNS